MEGISNNPLLKVTKEDVDAVNRFYEIDDDRIKKSLDAIEDWISKQDHLVEASKYLNRQFLRIFFILAKGSIENTKMKIDKILTLRALIPEICFVKSPMEFENIYDSVKYVPLPQISSKDNTRIIIIQLVPDKFDEFSLHHFLKFANMISEYRLNYEYCLGERSIIYMSNLSIISKINPLYLKKADTIGEAYGAKIKGIHILNAPPYIDTFVRLIKQTLREKVSKRLYIHKSYEELYEHIPKEILPKDYGGDEVSIEKLCEQWQEHLKTEEATRLITESSKIISDESKRSSSQYTEDYMGMPGSFRKLNVD